MSNSLGKMISQRSAFAFRSRWLLERWPQVCRVKFTFTKLSTNRFVSPTKKSMKCVVNWIPLRIRARSRNTQPHLNINNAWNPNLIYYDRFVFCSIPRLFVCLRMRMSTSKQYANVYVNQYSRVRGPLRECRPIRSGASGLPYYCAPLVCISVVMELLAVWRHYKPKTKNTVDPISTVFSSRWISIDRRYRPYSQVGESALTVDIDRIFK